MARALFDGKVEITKMRIAVFTLGCKTNLYESGQIVSALCAAGHDAFHGLEPADVFVLNTCAITAEAEKKSRQLVTRARKLNPNCRVVVVGCASEKNPAQFEGLANVTIVKGVHGKTKVVDEILGEGVDVEQIPSAYEETVTSTQEHTRAFVKIQDGCNNFCTYCIVPYLRGRSRSRRVADVVAEVKQANAAETVITGIDISQFGRDTGESLPMLFAALTNVPTRLRLGSLEAGVVTEELLQSLTHVNFCPHFHLSLQSGCDATLKRMNRKYDTATYFAAVESIRRVFPTAAITTDVIVGFCGETDEEFAQTLAFVQKVGFADVHVFPYSPRQGAVSAKWKDTDPVVKKHRAEVLGELKLQLKERFALANKGSVQRVLVEEIVDGKAVGYTPNYLRVYFDADPLTVGTLVDVVVGEPYADGATATPVQG